MHLVLRIVLGPLVALAGIAGFEGARALARARRDLHKTLWGDGPRDPALLPGTPEHAAAYAEMERRYPLPVRSACQCPGCDEMSCGLPDCDECESDNIIRGSE